jgi:exonuclease III
MELKSQTDSNTEVVVTLTLFHQQHPDKKINKEILELIDTKVLMDLTDVYRVFHHATAQYTFFSVAHANFSKIDPILGHKETLNKYKKF